MCPFLLLIVNLQTFEGQWTLQIFPTHVPAGNLYHWPWTLKMSEILTTFLVRGKSTVPYSRDFLVYQAQTAALKKNEVCLYLWKRKLYELIPLLIPFYTMITGFSDHWFYPCIHSSHSGSLRGLFCECRYLFVVGILGVSVHIHTMCSL